MWRDPPFFLNVYDTDVVRCFILSDSQEDEIGERFGIYGVTTNLSPATIRNLKASYDSRCYVYGDSLATQARQELSTDPLAAVGREVVTADDVASTATSSPTGYSLRCDQCETTLQGLSDIMQHTDIHTSRRCYRCGRRFDDLIYLHSHIAMFHLQMSYADFQRWEYINSKKSGGISTEEVICPSPVVSPINLLIASPTYSQSASSSAYQTGSQDTCDTTSKSQSQVKPSAANAQQSEPCVLNSSKNTARGEKPAAGSDKPPRQVNSSQLSAAVDAENRSSSSSFHPESSSPAAPASQKMPPAECQAQPAANIPSYKTKQPVDDQWHDSSANPSASHSRTNPPYSIHRTYSSNHSRTTERNHRQSPCRDIDLRVQNNERDRRADSSRWRQTHGDIDMRFERRQHVSSSDSPSKDIDLRVAYRSGHSGRNTSSHRQDGYSRSSSYDRNSAERYWGGSREASRERRSSSREDRMAGRHQSSG